MTKSPGSQSTSMNTTAHQVRLHPVGVSSRFQGHCGPGDDVLMLRCLDHQRSTGGAKVPIQNAVKNPSGIHGGESLGGHGRSREHRDLAHLMCLCFTVLPVTRSLDPWERTSVTPTDLYRGARGSAYPRCARRTLPRSKRRIQRGHTTSGRCQFF